MSAADDLERARAQWSFRGSSRPEWAVEPGPGQESVWDYPRPPRLDVETRPMRGQVRYTPTKGDHIRSAGLCASCHTLYTEHHGTPFPEQTPYLEWRNSVYTDEDGETETSRTCVDCHMANVGRMRIARNPAGRVLQASFIVRTNRPGWRRAPPRAASNCPGLRAAAST